MISKEPTLLLVLTALGLISLPVLAANQTPDAQATFEDCGSIQNSYGPWDYTNPMHFAEKLPIVENYHFNANVETLTKGMSSVWVGSDIDYTLRAFPNHPRALNAMGNLALRHSDMRVPPGANWSGDCYFQRALKFKPDDPTVKMIYGTFLARQQKMNAAKDQFEQAVALQPQSAEAHYNLGLVYEKLGNDQLALDHAKTAYSLGFPLHGLRAILERKGVWKTD